MRSSRWMALPVALWAFCGGVASVAVAQESTIPVGVLLWVPSDTEQGAERAQQEALDAAQETGSGEWSLQRLVSEPSHREAPPADRVEALTARYLEADFLSCLSDLQHPDLDADALLAAGFAEHAVRVGVLGAACALGGGDVPLARRLLEPWVRQEHDLAPVLPLTPPDFQALVEAVRETVTHSPRVTLEVRTDPPGSRVTVNGFRSCATSPCRFELLTGTHLITLERLGYQRRSHRQRVESNRHITLSMDRASAEEAEQQLLEALRAGHAPDADAFLETASHAYGARLSISLRHTANKSHAALYDRVRGEVLARASVSGEAAPARATGAVIQEWQGLAEPTPLVAEPWFWAGIGAAAALTAVIVFVAVSPPEPSYDLVFRAR